MNKIHTIILLSTLSFLAATFLGGFAYHPTGAAYDRAPGAGEWHSILLKAVPAVVVEDPMWEWLRQTVSHVATLRQTLESARHRVKTVQYFCGGRARYLSYGSAALHKGAPDAAQNAFYIARQFSTSCWRELHRLDRTLARTH